MNYWLSSFLTPLLRNGASTRMTQFVNHERTRTARKYMVQLSSTVLPFVMLAATSMCSPDRELNVNVRGKRWFRYRSANLSHKYGRHAE